MKKKLKIGTLTALIGLVVLIWGANYTITKTVADKIYTSVTEIPKNNVGLVLGTSKKLTNGNPNLYYSYRISATLALYNAKKINFVLVSGDNGSKYYNEPETFKKDLIAGGIPAEKIFLDYAGFRTLDSMVRAKEIFGLTDVTIISQKFHNERAIYLAKKKGLNAIGFNAKDVSGRNGLKVQLREYLARVKVFIDLLLQTEPKFYGNRIEIK